MILEDAYIRFIIENDLTQGQYLVLHLIYKKRPDLIKAYKEAFPTDDGTMIGAYFINKLFDKGLLEKKGDGTIVVTSKFLETFINKHTASEEIYAMYPTFFNKDGVNIPLSAYDRNQFANLYDIAIQSSVLEHIEVVKDLQFAIDNNLLVVGIEKFVKSKFWLSVRTKRLEGDITQITQTIRDEDF